MQTCGLAEVLKESKLHMKVSMLSPFAKILKVNILVFNIRSYLEWSKTWRLSLSLHARISIVTLSSTLRKWEEKELSHATKQVLWRWETVSSSKQLLKYQNSTLKSSTQRSKSTLYAWSLLIILPNSMWWSCQICTATLSQIYALV